MPHPAVRARFRTLRSIPFSALLVAAALCGAVPSADAADRFADRVGTMPLDTKLDARGNLGGVTVDRLGFIYVANFRDAVWRIDPEGHVETLTRSLYGASGNAVDSRGRLYQSNFLGNTITRIDRTGEVATFADRGLEGPVGIAVTPGDTLFVCNCRGNTLSRVTPDGRVTPFAKSERFACPNGAVFDERGVLYVTNFNSPDILAVTPNGRVSVFATVPGGPGNAHIAYVKGFFYVTKIMTHQIVKVAPDGTFRTLAGSGQPGTEDGDALQATLDRPNGIAVSPQGDVLYVNTMVGDYATPKPSELQVRTIELTTLTKILRAALDAGSVDDAVAAYRAYKADSVRGMEDTSAEVIALGYNLLSNRRGAEAIRLFALNAESYPGNVAAQYHYGEALRYAGRLDDARARYRRVLELEPGEKRAASRLEQLDADTK